MRYMIENPVTTDSPDGFSPTFVPVPTLQSTELRTNRRILRGNAENKRWKDSVVPEVFTSTSVETGGPKRGQNPFNPPKGS